MTNTNDSKDQNKNQTVPDDAANKAYGQYIDPNYHKKQQKKKLLIVITSILAVLVAIIIVAVIVASMSSSPESSSAGNGSANGDNTAAGNICEDEECFNEQFSACQTALYEGQGVEENNTVEYRISGVQSTGCLVTLQYVDSTNEEIIGKGMTCDFDNELKFREALTLVDEYTDDYECEGSLVDFYNGLEEEARALYGI